MKYSSILILSCLSLVALARPASAEDAPTLAISGGRLVDGYGGLPVQNALVLVAGDRISRVGDVNSVSIPDGVKTLDANGMTILPGLWESHGHLFHIGEGDPASFPLKFKSRAGSIMAAVAKTSLLAGITSFRDTGGPIAEQQALRAEIEAGQLPGPRLFLAGPILHQRQSRQAQHQERLPGRFACRSKAGNREKLSAWVSIRSRYMASGTWKYSR